MLRAIAALVLLVGLAGPAAAQINQAPPMVLTPESTSRWDVAAHVTWLGERLDMEGVEWDRWYGVASGGASVGYYSTPHLKLEVDVVSSTTGESYSLEPLPAPGPGFPVLRQRNHRFRATTAAAGLKYQFLENAWFHPFVGTGVELMRERERVETAYPIVGTRDPRAPVTPPAPTDETIVHYRARPFIEAGFKGYVSERAFIRSDLRTSWSRDGIAALAWRSGLGFDF